MKRALYYIIIVQLAVLSSCKDDNGVTETPDTKIPGVKAVDLGLSVKWADANVGASISSDYGYYYAWGEIKVKQNYSWLDYKWAGGNSSSLSKYCMSATYGEVDNRYVLEAADDIASVAFGGKWRMPTIDEWKEIKEKCTWEKKIDDGVFRGYTISNQKTGASIFLPAAGGWEEDEPHRTGTTGFYWASDLYETKSCYANVFFFNNGGLATSYGNRSFGLPVRAVLAE